MNLDTLEGSGVIGLAESPAADSGKMGNGQGSGHIMADTQRPAGGPAALQQSQVRAFKLQHPWPLETH